MIAGSAPALEKYTILMNIIHRAPQTIDYHAVFQLPVAHHFSITGLGQDMRRNAHIFLATGNHDIGVSATDSMKRQMHRLQSAAANLVVMVMTEVVSGNPAINAA